MSSASEGQFGEWPGYYVSDCQTGTGHPGEGSLLSQRSDYFRRVAGAAAARQHLSPFDHQIRQPLGAARRARISGITGVYRPESGGEIS